MLNVPVSLVVVTKVAAVLLHVVTVVDTRECVTKCEWKKARRKEQKTKKNMCEASSHWREIARGIHPAFN